MKESLRDLLTRALEEKEQERDRAQSEVDAIKTALKSVGVTRIHRSSPRESNGDRTIMFRGVTTQAIEFLTKRGAATPQQMWEAGIKAKDFNSFKACLTSAFRTGKLTRTMNKKGFYEYSLPGPEK